MKFILKNKNLIIFLIIGFILPSCIIQEYRKEHLTGSFVGEDSMNGFFYTDLRLYESEQFSLIVVRQSRSFGGRGKWFVHNDTLQLIFDPIKVKNTMQLNSDSLRVNNTLKLELNTADYILNEIVKESKIEGTYFLKIKNKNRLKYKNVVLKRI